MSVSGGKMSFGGFLEALNQGGTKGKCERGGSSANGCT